MGYKANEILSLKVYGSYPNLKSIISSMNHIKPGKDRFLDGYRPLKVEYMTPDGRKMIKVHSIDAPFLTHPDPEETKKYLLLILDAKRGNKEEKAAAKKELAEKISSYYQNTIKNIQNISPVENEYVVPSNTSSKPTKDQISDKGSTLLTLTQKGYPVPDFVVITSKVYPLDPNERERHIEQAVCDLEQLTSRIASSPHDPLIFALRCAGPRYYPGILPTYLNVGVTDGVLPALTERYGKIAALQTFLNNMRNILMFLSPEKYKTIEHDIKPYFSESEVDSLWQLVQRLYDEIKSLDPRLLTDPIYQTAFFVSQAYKNYNDNLSLIRSLSKGEMPPPSIILQQMVCTVKGERSYAGVLNSRHSKTGVGAELNFARKIFGEEIMTGTVRTEEITISDLKEIKDRFPAVHHFFPLLAKLEKDYQVPVTIEFAVEEELFALLQLNPAQLTGQAMYKATWDLCRAGVIPPEKVSELIQGYHSRQMKSPSIDRSSLNELKVFCQGASLLPRTAVSAKVYFSTKEALAAKERGESVCLFKRSFSPTETLDIEKMDVIVCLTSFPIHIVTICQGHGIPALSDIEKYGATLADDGRLINSEGLEIKEGDWITVSSNQKILYMGKAEYSENRLFQYINDKKNITLDDKEKKLFPKLAAAYLGIEGLMKGSISKLTFRDVIKYLQVGREEDKDEKKKFANQWFDFNELPYLEEIFQSGFGDHHDQIELYHHLTMDRKIKLFKSALARCKDKKLSGYKAGWFILGCFASQQQPIAFWKAFSSSEISAIINEWVLFKKYRDILSEVGERKIQQARERILTKGLDQLLLNKAMLDGFMTLKLSKNHLNLNDTIAEGSDPQTKEVIDLLLEPYSTFFDYDKPWSIGTLENICKQEQIPIPDKDDI